MRKGVVFGLIGLGVLAIVLMVTVAWNGSKLDEARQERDDLQLEVDDLRQEVDTLTGERDDLQKKVDEHLKTIEHLKSQGAPSAPGTGGASSTAAPAATP